MSRTTTLKGNPFNLEGPELNVGDEAPDATLAKDLVNEVSLNAYNGTTRIVSVVPSLDTPVCAQQTKRFNEAAANLPGVTFITVSCDLPPAQARFCGAENIDPEKITFLSDHRKTEFGTAYGTLVPDLRIESRAVFVVGPDNTLRYVEYVPEIAEHPDYDAALAAAKAQQ